MSITSGFFNSVDGDRLYNAEEMTTYFEGLVSDGVYANVGEAFQVLASGSGLGITVGTGRALVKTHWIKNDARLPLTLAAADVQYDRVDAVVLRCDLTDSVRALTVEIKTGTPAANAAAPEIVNTQTVKEMPLAFIKIPRGATTITQANITDTRASTACGWITGLVEQVDTGTLFLQYHAAYTAMLQQMNNWQLQKQAAFEAWFGSLTESLHVDTTLHKYEQATELRTATAEIPVIDNYEDGDILLVHIGGVLFVEGDEYSVADGKITFKHTYNAGNVITQILIKSIIGHGVISDKIDEINGEAI
jgi:hypothetical protein